MAVQNPFFGKRDSDSFSSRNSVTGLSTGSATTGSNPGMSPLSSNMPQASAPSRVQTAVAAAPQQEPTSGSKLTVGPNIKLKGVEITDCDTLVVEGTVEATMNSRVIKIAETGACPGTAEIDIAEIHGSFDGTLTVREKLMIFGSGRVSGKIRYGKVVIEEGGELTGQIEAGTASSSAMTLPINKSISSPVNTSAEGSSVSATV